MLRSKRTPARTAGKRAHTRCHAQRVFHLLFPPHIPLCDADSSLFCVALASLPRFALRRVIEKYTRNARFCLICNYASKIIPALQSRCTRFRFAPLEPQQALDRLQVVAEAEGCVTTPEGLDACVALGVGDMRKSLNILQSTHMAFDEISVSNVYQCTGSPTPETVEAILSTLISDEFDVAFETAWNTMRLKGLALQDILTSLLEMVIMLEVKDSLAKARLVASLADLEHRLSVGTNEKLQLAGLVGLFVASRTALTA